MSEQSVTIEILEPRGEILHPQRYGLSAPRLTTLEGKRIALCSEKVDSRYFFNRIEELILQKYPTAKVDQLYSSTRPGSLDNTKEILANYDCFVDGIKTSTSSTYSPDIVMEKQGLPGISVCVDSLIKQRQAHAETDGMPRVRVLYLPAIDYFKSKSSQELMNHVADNAFDELVELLTKPLTEEEKTAEDFTYDYSPKKFTGATYTEAYEKFYSYCTQNFVGDAFPFVPPTREAVDKMLTGTTLPPDHVVGIMEPKSGIATVEKIAISAVMAGAKPEYLPLIISMVELITDPCFNQYHICNEIQPVFFLSGPIIEELGINNEIGYLAPGYRQNSTIPRALSLCTMNIGWRLMDAYASPGCIGQPNAYVNWFVPENQKMSPWEPYNVSLGFKPEDNVFTCCETYGVKYGPSEILTNTSFEDELEQLKNLFAPMGGFPRKDVPVNHNTRYMVVIHPTFAEQLTEAGFTRESLIQWLHDENTIDWDKMSEQERADFIAKLGSGRTFGSIKREMLQPGFKLEPFTDPKNVAVIVSGGPTGGVLVFWTLSASTSIGDKVKEERPFMHKVVHNATLTENGK